MFSMFKYGKCLTTQYAALLHKFAMLYAMLMLLASHHGSSSSLACGVQELHSNKPESNIIGQKSEKALMAASGKKGKKGRASAQAPAEKDAKISYNKSGSVFKRMQEQKEAAAAGSVPSLGHGDTDGPVRKKAASLKL